MRRIGLAVVLALSFALAPLATEAQKAPQPTFGKGGKPYNFREAVCLETQHFPDSPNKPSFPTTVLNPGQTFTSITIYKFLPMSSAGKN